MLRRRAADHTAVMEKAGGSEHRTNVFLVEDSASIRSRLSEMLGAVEGVSIVGEAESPAAAIDGILRTQPDSVVLDMHLTGGTGIEVLRKVCPVAPHIVFIMLTNHPEPQYRKVCLQSGATHFLDKSTEFDKVMDVIAGLHSTH
jgi:DNA-binding NarL/FixJ family response regulator